MRQKRVVNDASTQSDENASLRKRIEALGDHSVLETVSLHSGLSSSDGPVLLLICRGGGRTETSTM